jgi:hypothetical protein
MIENKLPKFDPKLKEALAEIEAICHKYGIGAAIALASSTHAEFGTIFPWWSGLQVEDGGFRIKLRKAEEEKAEATMHLAYCLRDMSGLMFQNFEAVTQTIASKIDVEHHPFGGDWDMDGWKKPNLPATPHTRIDFKKRDKKKKPKGFNQL